MRANELTKELIISKGFKVEFGANNQPIVSKRLTDGTYKAITPSYVGAGYLQIYGLGYLQRIAYAWYYGICPSADQYGNDLEVDHKNHNKCDNSIDNLRLVTKVENNKNRRRKVRKSAQRMTIDALLKQITELNNYIIELEDKEQLW